MAITAVDVLTAVRKNLGDFSSSFGDTALKGDVVVTEVRQITGDTVATYRIADTTMLIYVNDGQRDIVKRLPWLLWTVAGVTQTYADATGVTSSDTLFVPQKLKAALVAYVVMRCCLQTDGANFNGALAAEHQKLYEQAIATSPYRWANNVLLASLTRVMRDLWDMRPHLRVADDGTFNSFTAPTISGDTVPTADLCLPDVALPALIAGVTADAFKHDHANATSAAMVTRYTQEYEFLKRGL